MKTLRELLKELAVLAVIAGFLFCLAPVAFAQQPTRIYGSAYQTPWYQGYYSFSYRCHVTVYAEDGSYWNECDTDWLGDYWLDGVPSNRWYIIQARAIFAPSLSSDAIRVWVPERPWWQSNQTHVPTLWCYF